jgi:dodecin
MPPRVTLSLSKGSDGRAIEVCVHQFEWQIPWRPFDELRVTVTPRNVHAKGDDRSRKRGGKILSEDNLMANVVKVLEVMSESEKGWEDAVQNAVMRAAETIHGIKSVYVDNFTATVEGDRITTYRVDAKISFLLDGGGNGKTSRAGERAASR